MANYTQAQLDALRSAVARGVREVSYDGETVKYGTTQEMLRLISLIERDLSGNAVVRRVFRTTDGLR